MAYNSWSVIAGETPTESKWNILGTNDADFDSRLDLLEADKVMAAGTDGATVTFNLLTSKIWYVVAGGDRQLALSNVPVGKYFSVSIIQGTGGGHVPLWWNNIKWSAGTVPPFSANEGDIDTFIFIQKDDDPEEFWGYAGGFMLETPPA